MAIFFDLDDTLLDDRGAQAVYLAQVYAAWRADLPHDKAAFQAAWRGAVGRHFNRYLRGELSFADQRRFRIRDVFQAPSLPDDEADRRFREFLDLYEASWRLFDDVVPTLDALEGRPLGVITNGSDAQQRAKLARTGIAGRFAVVLTSEGAGFAKPDPEIFRAAAASLAVAPGRCVHVGDDWGCDVEGARRAGLRPVWLDRSAGRASAPLPPESETPGVARISTLTELIPLLD